MCPYQGSTRIIQLALDVCGKFQTHLKNKNKFDNFKLVSDTEFSVWPDLAICRHFGDF